VVAAALDKAMLERAILEDAVVIASRAAFAASRPLMESYSPGVSFTLKEDRTPLTEADLKADEIIRSLLSQAELGDRGVLPVLSEESRPETFSVRRDWSMFWLVDPLDGTNEFIAQTGDFAVNIALVCGRCPAVGVVFAPDKKDLYFGGQGLGAFKLRVSDVEVLLSRRFSFHDLIVGAECLADKTESLKHRKNITIVHSRVHRSSVLDQFIEAKRAEFEEVKVATAGSALKLCFVAEGRADIYPRFGTTMEWDTAAGHAILNAVGRKVVDYHGGEELVYNKEDLRNPWFVAE